MSSRAEDSLCFSCICAGIMTMRKAIWHCELRGTVLEGSTPSQAHTCT